VVQEISHVSSPTQSQIVARDWVLVLHPGFIRGLGIHLREDLDRIEPMMKPNKQPIRDFMKEHYTDERLAELLAHAQDGKLSYYSCCCFIGVATAQKALVGATVFNWHGDKHYTAARRLSGAITAEAAFGALGNAAKRRRLLIPMIRAEMKRRAKVQQACDAWQQDSSCQERSQ
jgi:hypothetical protein